MMRHRTALLVLLGAVSVGAVERPAECPQEDWDTACIGKLTCADIADEDIYCEGVSTFGADCATKCAAPCCITMTTSTTSATETMTGTSITVTETSMTETTATITVTGTSATETITVSQTSHTATTTATHTITGTATATATFTSITETTLTTLTTNTTTETTVTTVTPSISESTTMQSVVVRVPLEVEVDDLASYLNHSSVPDAYATAFAEASGINISYIEARMEATGEHSASLLLVITIPASPDASQNESDVLIPVISIDEVQTMIHSVDVAAFSQRVSELIDAEFGAGTYTQKVLSGEGAKTGGHDTDAVASAPSSCRWPAAALLMVLTSWLC